MVRFPSGQREQTVNLPAYAFRGSNPLLTTILFYIYFAAPSQKAVVVKNPE
jgi:hypothetical protein